MKPSDVQDDLMPGAAARREAEQLGGTRRAAGYAVTRLGLLRRRLARSPDACPAGGDHRWRGAEKPAAERVPWPPGRWERCAGCHAYRVAP